jgi:hypothetical protein
MRGTCVMGMVALVMDAGHLRVEGGEDAVRVVAVNPDVAVEMRLEHVRLVDRRGRVVDHSIGFAVRPLAATDVEAADALCRRIHGHARHADLTSAVEQGTASVVEREGRIAGYTTGIGFFGHAVGETTADLRALIAAAPSFAGPGFLVPTRNAALMRWCLERGLRIVQPMTLMTMGPYRDPAGAFLPSVLY